MLNTISAAIGNTWSLPFENPFIIWFQSLGGTNGYFHYFFISFDEFYQYVRRRNDFGRNRRSTLLGIDKKAESKSDSL